jgi:hypothetical protein
MIMTTVEIAEWGRTWTTPPTTIHLIAGNRTSGRKFTMENFHDFPVDSGMSTRNPFDLKGISVARQLLLQWNTPASVGRRGTHEESMDCCDGDRDDGFKRLPRVA